MIKAEKYRDLDLRKSLLIHKDFDNAIILCLEVAEHIEEKYADVLIDNLCKLGDTIIFSAAIPFQGGNNHVNEQWQTYWAKKFYEKGFGCKWIYPEIRENKNICLWYRNNIVIYQKGVEKKEVKDFILPEYYEQIVKNLKRIS